MTILGDNAPYRVPRKEYRGWLGIRLYWHMLQDCRCQPPYLCGTCNSAAASTSIPPDDFSQKLHFQFHAHHVLQGMKFHQAWLYLFCEHQQAAEKHHGQPKPRQAKPTVFEALNRCAYAPPYSAPSKSGRAGPSARRFRPPWRSDSEQLHDSFLLEEGGSAFFSLLAFHEQAESCTYDMGLILPHRIASSRPPLSSLHTPFYLVASSSASSNIARICSQRLSPSVTILDHCDLM